MTKRLHMNQNGILFTLYRPVYGFTANRYRIQKTMPFSLACERVLEDGLPLTAEVNEITECNSSVVQNTQIGVDEQHGRNRFSGGRSIPNASRNTGVQYPPIPDTMLVYSTIKVPIASSIFQSILQLPS